MQLFAVGLLQILSVANASTPAPRAQLDSSATVNAVIVAQRKFIETWRLEWLRSDWYRWVASGRQPVASERLKTYTWAAEVECARRDAKSGVDVANNAGVLEAPWASEQRALVRPACPGWISRGSLTPDASLVLDSALTPARRIRIAHARDSLLTLVRDAANAFPRDQFLVMQHLRLLLDQSYRAPRYLDEAMRVANRCDIYREFCESLRGLVFARRGMIDSAAKAFAIMQAEVNKGDYCFQDNTLALMPMLEGGAFSGTPPACETRVAMNERFWWLADPLWSDSINERRVEHDARNMSRILTGAFTRSERLDWMPAKGVYHVNNAELYMQLITRYGWPSQMLWPVAAQQKEIAQGDSTTLVRFRQGVDPIASMQSPPVTTYAYAKENRVHTSPNWDALLSPFTASSSDWHLDASTDADGKAAWAIEHFKRDRPLYDIADHQMQTWRRKDSLVFAIAASWPSARSGVSAARGGYAATLVRSTGVGDAHAVARANGSVGSTTRFRVALPADSSLLSLEFIGQNALKSDARMRFALLPEIPLAKLYSGEVALSTPLLVKVAPGRRASARASGAVSVIANADDAAVHMYGTTTVGERRIGLYWESYGFRTGDMLQTTVHVERADALGKLVRVGITRGGVLHQLRGTRVTWSAVVSGTSDVLSESAELDVSGLRPGAYVITIASQTRDGRGAMSWRDVIVMARN